ncbi:MAG: methyltransferase domain-containing protein [Anaerolineae bacterium]
MSKPGPAHSPQDHRICDYEGSPYRQVFWDQADRDFEDAAERLALRDLLPPTGGSLVEIGAGFGRLVDEYAGYDTVVLLDYARSMLVDARERLGDGLLYVCADLYSMPFATGGIDTAVQVRVLHHVERIEDALAEVARAVRDEGAFVLEFANKRHLKSIARYAARRQVESPFDKRPHEFIDLNWNFHPAHVERALRDAGFVVEERRAVSHFRLPLAKRVIPPRLLARLDHAIGRPLAGLALAPSQMVLANRVGGARRSFDSAAHALWRCPACGHEPLADDGAEVPCPSCGRRWPIVDGVYVFRDGAVDS